ncbi:MAG: hypothetical protein SFT91_01755 [Rickettsiaceae bacterium]|nr:hypothetical protein [Rickettsiaceae bacterium]
MSKSSNRPIIIRTSSQNFYELLPRVLEARGVQLVEDSDNSNSIRPEATIAQVNDFLSMSAGSSSIGCMHMYFYGGISQLEAEKLRDFIIQNRSIEHFHLCIESLSDDTSLYIISAGFAHNKTIKFLTLSTSISGGDHSSIINILAYNKNIEKLVFTMSNLVDRDIASLSNMLKINKSIKYLCIDNNATIRDISGIAEMIQVNKTITDIGFTSSLNLRNENLIPFVKSLSGHESIKRVSLQNYNISSLDLIENIARLLSHNNKISAFETNISLNSPTGIMLNESIRQNYVITTLFKTETDSASRSTSSYYIKRNIKFFCGAQKKLALIETKLDLRKFESADIITTDSLLRELSLMEMRSLEAHSYSSEQKYQFFNDFLVMSQENNNRFRHFKKMFGIISCKDAGGDFAKLSDGILDSIIEYIGDFDSIIKIFMSRRAMQHGQKRTEHLEGDQEDMHVAKKYPPSKDLEQIEECDQYHNEPMDISDQHISRAEMALSSLGAEAFSEESNADSHL